MKALIYYGYSSQAHLTAGILGASLGTMLGLDYHLGEIIGFGVGTGVSTGYIPVESSSLSGPVSTGFAGASLAHATAHSGIIGAVGGALASYIDESGGVYEGDYLSQTVVAANRVIVLKPYFVYLFTSIPLVGKAIARVSKNTYLDVALISVVFLYSTTTSSEENEMKSPDNSIRTPEQLKEEIDGLCKRITDTDVVTQMARKQVSYKLGASVLSTWFSMKLATHTQVFNSHLANVGPNNLPVQAKFNNALVAFGMFLVPYITQQLVDVTITNYQTETLHRVLKRSIKEKIMSGESPLYLKENLTLASDVKRFERNVQTLAIQGVRIIWSTTDSYTTALHSSLLLFKNNALDVMTVLKSYSSLIEAATSQLQTMKYDNTVKIEELETKVTKFKNDIIDNPKAVINGGKLDFLQEKITKLEILIRKTDADNFKWSMLTQAITITQAIANMIVSYSLVASKTTAGDLEKKSLYAAKSASSDLLSSGNWFLKNNAHLMGIQRAKESLTRVLDYIERRCDQISTLVISHENGSKNALHLKDFAIGITNHDKGSNIPKENLQPIVLLTPSTVDIPAGRYVVTGKSGSGKSSFLSKIGGIECNGIYAHGQISFISAESVTPVIVQVTQEDYIAPFSSLLEVLTDRTVDQLADDEEVREKAKELLLALQIDDQGTNGIVGKLDEEKNWGTLSGGQKRKVALVTMLLKKPQFVILDETFAGLDESSIKLAQQLIRKELAGSVILVVDHQAEGNNHDNFYQYDIHLEDKRLTKTGIR